MSSSKKQQPLIRKADATTQLNSKKQLEHTYWNMETEMKRNIRTVTIMCLLLSVPTLSESGDAPESGLTLTPEQLLWEPNPRVPGLSVARIISKGTEAGTYVYRVKFPKGRVVQAHSHPDDRTYTVLSGTWYVGWGEKFDENKLTALKPGSFYTEPAGVPHFISTPDSETIVQITGVGPTTIHYVDNPAHASKK
jgi:quercetin dioxygenase-like cupin family protein